MKEPRSSEAGLPGALARALAAWRAGGDALRAVGARLSGPARGVRFRLAFAALCLATHLGVAVHSGERFGVPFNAAPEVAPSFRNPATDAVPGSWNRLVLSRWDSGQYIELGLRGYQHCPPPGPDGKTVVGGRACNLAFYPTYGLVGRVVSLGGVIPIDYALLAVSLVSSFIFLFLWTGPALVERLGLGLTYLSLVLFNFFTTGFSLVTVQTEPLTLVLTLGAFVAFRRRWWLLAGFLAGGASAMRITAVAVGAAAGLALVVEAWQNRPATRAAWARLATAVLLCGWGAFALMGYHFVRFGDALAYVHTHAQQFHHEPSILSVLAPKAEWLMFAIENPQHEGVWLVGSLLWFLVGHRAALGRFPVSEQAFWYALVIGTFGIAMVGLAPIGFVGMNRYSLLALPIFFATAATLRARPAALCLWLAVCAWHYWNVDLCYYTGGPGNHALEVCHAKHWIGRI